MMTGLRGENVTNFWEGKTVLVTGSEGLIGRPMMQKLGELGANRNFLDAVLGHDICDYGAMLRLFEDEEPDICIHLAAISGVEDSRAAGPRAYEVNVMGTVNVLEACREAGVKAVVTASSNHVYGGPHPKTYPDGHVDEHAQFKQMDTYSVTKICADYITRSYYHNYGLPTVAVRNTNCYGPDDPHMDHLIPGTIQSVLDGKRPVIKSNGKTRKSYLYVDDVVDAYLLMARLLYETPEHWAGLGVNVSDRSTTTLNIVKSILVLMDVPYDYIEILSEPNDQHDEWLDSSLIREMGWRPQTRLLKGLEKTIAGFKERYAERIGSGAR
jgi:CDP-glucose 4,6-dehydratase